MAKKEFELQSVVKDLQKKSSLKIDYDKGTIKVLSNSGDLGNKSWGKIDYLKKAHGFQQVS